MSTAEVDPQHTQWVLVPWDPESTSFGPFLDSIHVFADHHQSVHPTTKLSTFSPLSPLLTLYYYFPYLRHKHPFHLCSPTCPDTTQHYLCFHSIRTQPFTRESCITYPVFTPLSRRLVVFYVLLFHSNLFFHPSYHLQRAILCTLSLYPILYPPL